jgi:uncharacterized protein HemX
MFCSNKSQRFAKEFALKASDKKLHPKVRESLNLPATQVEWIRGNVTFSNVAARSLSSTHDVSTATVVKYGKLFEDT